MSFARDTFWLGLAIERKGRWWFTFEAQLERPRLEHTPGWCRCGDYHPRRNPHALGARALETFQEFDPERDR